MDLRARIQAGESAELEFKSVADADNVKVAVAAMLNTRGGTILIGVGEDGQLVGVPEAEQRALQIQMDLQRAIAPPAPVSVSRETIENNTFIVVDVPSGRDRPYVVDGQIYMRQGATSRIARPDGVAQMVMRRAEPLWERQLCLGAELSDLDMNEVRRVLHLATSAGRWEQQPPVEFLTRLQLISRGQPTNGAVVLFGLHPSGVLPQTRVRCTVWGKGERMLDNRTLEGNLFQLQAKIIGFFSSHVQIASELPQGLMARVDTPTIPQLAMREAVLNALAHRDYASYTGSVQVAVHADRMEVWNAGELPEGLKISDLTELHASRPRNPGIAHILYMAGLVEGFGVGTVRIAKSYAGRTEAPAWRVDSGGLRLILPFFGSAKDHAKVVLNERQQAMLSVWVVGHEFTSPEYRDHFASKVSARTARSDLSTLVEAGHLEQQGSGPATRYRVARLAD